MVQGFVNSRLYQTFSKRNEEEKPMDDKGRIDNEMRDWFRIKWKLLVSCAILITSVFIFTGIIIYLNLHPLKNCRKGHINVHFIPYMYSTLDPFESPEEYLTNDLYKSLEFVVQALEQDERRRFTITEIYPLWKWWRNQKNETKDSVRKLINEGRLEVSGGGWCVPDEAVVHYRDFIDQYTLGFRHLEEIAGRKITPDVSFLMDNRGHSREIASLMNAMDIKAVIFGGISPHEQCYRRTYQKMEFLWSDGDALGLGSEKPNLFTSIFDDRALKMNNYFAYENPVIDMNDVFATVMCQAYAYSTNSVFIPIGSQFRYKNMKNTFHVIESMINLTRYNTRYKMDILYSTPSSYLSSVERSNNGWGKSFGEFLPYAQSKFEYWTGYYSSRPTLKYLERVTSGFFQVFKQVLLLSKNWKEFPEALIKLRETVGFSQHHKAAIGVTSQANADYFTMLLHDNLVNSSETINDALNKVVAARKNAPQLQYESCLRLNISECNVSETYETFIVTVYNPSSRSMNRYVRVPVTRDNYLVRSGDGNALETQMVNIPEKILWMTGRESMARKELVFRATGIPALGFKSFYVKAVEGPTVDAPNPKKKKIALIINELTRRISGIERNNETFQMVQEMLFYTSWLSRNSVFRPESRPQTISHDVLINELNDGELVTEYEQDFGSWASQVIRIYRDEEFVEFKWVAGPIPISFFEGKEIITIFTTDIRNKDLYYVDANGKGLEQRRRGEELETESIGQYLARIYRPVSSHIAIKDRNTQLHVFNDRVQGGTSAFEGELELMIHRRLLGFSLLNRNDDLNEREHDRGLIATGHHWVFIGSNQDPRLKKSIEQFAATNNWEPWYFFANATGISYQDWLDNYVTQLSGVKRTLPKSLKILTLELWEKNKVLLRLEHTGEDDCDQVTVNLQDLFLTIKVVNATEVTLIGNGFKESRPYRKAFAANTPVAQENGKKLTNFFVSINSSKIKTFILEIEPLT